ncbi:unnamed protein product [Urochloa decumbens]|uniref:Uncharacterized protein n=1 Tax=Urochloa decumbens TaxID=240449 RepID=A0ABC9G9Z6_9POAL
MGNCFGLFSRGTTSPKPPDADGATSDRPIEKVPSSAGQPNYGVSPVGDEEDMKKPSTPPSENNGLPRVSSRPPSDVAGATPVRTTSHN